MKYLLNSMLFLLLSISAFANDTSIVFRQVSYSQLFELARNEKKAVMLYFHFDGCGACVKMEKTVFSDQNAADYYNSNFINFEINTRVGEGIETNKIYNVKLHPTFLFLDENGNELNKIVGIFSPEEFITHGKNALSSTQKFSDYKNRYNSGLRSADFLFDYCYRLRDADELDSVVINDYLNTQTLEELKSEKNIKFIYEFCIYEFDIFAPFNSRTYDFLRNNRELFYKYFDKDQVDTRIVWILNSTIYDAIEEKNEAIFNKAVKMIEEFDNGKLIVFKEMDGRTTGMIKSKHLVLSSKIAFYENMGKKVEYNDVLNEYIKKIWDDAEELNRIAWKYFENIDNQDRLLSALKWSQRSIELKPAYAYLDTYASLLYKTGDYNNALKYAEMAIEKARETETDFEETTKLVEKIKAKK